MKKKKEWKDASLHVCRGMMLCAAVSLLAGCTGESDETMPEKDGRVALKVSSGIEVQTRAHDEQWDAGDAIGIYMLDGETAEAANKNIPRSRPAQAAVSARQAGRRFTSPWTVRSGISSLTILTARS